MIAIHRSYSISIPLVVYDRPQPNQPRISTRTVQPLYKHRCIRLTKHPIQEINLLLPPSMRSHLPLREEERLSRIKASMDVIESTVFTSDLDDPGKTEEVDGGPACFEDDEVVGDEEG